MPRAYPQAGKGVRYIFPLLWAVQRKTGSGSLIRAGAGSPPPLACGAWAYTAQHDAFSPCLCLVVDAVCARRLEKQGSESTFSEKQGSESTFSEKQGSESTFSEVRQVEVGRL